MIRKFLYLISFISVSLMTLTGCSDDEPIIPGADGHTTLNLLIPSTETAFARTRAENVKNEHGSKLASEGHFNTLAVAGFYDEGSTHKHFFAELTSDIAITVDEVYRSYKLAVVPADYTLYILANIPTTSLNDRLNSKSLSSTATETLQKDVEKLVYSYQGEGTNAILPDPTETGLPMALKTTAKLKNGDHKSIVATLGFVCAKVRLTVIYNGVFGNTQFKVTGLTASNLYSPTTVFTPEGGHGTGSTTLTGTIAGEEPHYSLTDDEAARTLDDWMSDDINSANIDPLDLITSEKKVLGDDELQRFVWQQTAYIPEAVGKSAAPTTLKLNTSKGVKDITFGCNDGSASHTGDAADIRRGHFYDVVAMVADNGEVTLRWKVRSWQPADMTVHLAGLSNLYVAETHICTTEATALTGDKPYEIAYETKSPLLSFDIPEVTLPGMSTAMKLFVVEEDKENGVIRVKLNSNIPDDLTGRFNLNDPDDCTPGFWVVSGNIRKFIQVDYINLEKYLRILPDDMNIYISNIVNSSQTQNYYFDYATNSTGLRITIPEFENNNTNQYNGTTKKNGIYLTICDSDKNPLSEPYPLQNLVGDDSDDNILTKIGQLPGIDEYPDDGYLCLSIVEPSDPTYFSKTISGTFKVYADYLEPDTADFKISPVPTVYTIHFRDVKNEWGVPHIYVYQPLEYNGIEVYGENRVYDDNGNLKEIINLNWLEYSFTGNMAFKGWKKDGGSIDNITGSTSEFNDGGGSPVIAYNVGEKWGYPSGGNTGTLPTGYYSSVHLVDYSKSHCDNCKNYGPFQLWPGGGMRKETIGGETWWTIELPLLAKPEKALVMFADGHDRNSGTRYPGGGVPGIPLPNYSDREAWFLYNSSDAVHEFSDNRPSGTPSNPVTPTADTHVLISWPNDLYKNGDGPLNKIYMFQKDNTSNVPFGAWSGTKEKYKVSGKYWIWVPVNTFNPTLSTDGKYIFILNDGNGHQTANTDFSSAYVEVKTDINAFDNNFKTYLSGQGVKVSKYYVITSVKWE